MCNNNPIVWITRPYEQAQETSNILEKYSIKTLLSPALRLKYLSLNEQEILKFNAFIATSINAIKAVSHTEAIKKKPFFCVGASSKTAAINLGFLNIIESYYTSNSKGLLQTLLQESYLKNKKLLYLRGKEINEDIVTSLKLKGYNISEEVVYQTLPMPLSQQTISLLKLKKIKFITLFSKKTTTVIKHLFKKHHLFHEASEIICLCLSQSIAEEAKTINWKDIAVDSKIENFISKIKQYN